jgi:signal transduction histidine kinase/HAMP domain-containing protein
MKKKILISLAILFSLFFAGTGLSMRYQYNTNSNLQAIIDLHRVEIIRQNLVIKAQTVQSHLYSFGTSFGSELDVIVENVLELDSSAQKCLQCHHKENIAMKIEEVVSLVDQYQDALSYLITTTANKARVERLKTVTIGIGMKLLDRAQEMTVIAGEKLKERTAHSIKEINHSRSVLVFTLVTSFFIAIFIAITMIRQVTEPIYALVDATRHIQSGELGYTTPFKGAGEFAELMRSFNEMSVTLDQSNKKIMKHINNLSNLYTVTLTFHSITSRTDIFRELARGASDLVGAEQAGLMLIEDDEFVHTYPAAGMDLDASKKIRFAKKQILNLYDPTRRRAYINNNDIKSSPTADVDTSLNVRNLMLVWVRQKGEITGLIRVANKKAGDFTAEDVQPLAILANNASVALDNAQLYSDLKSQMDELKNAQEQLIQAAKLVAIGELASNVAHELNNPLTTVLGYVDLLMEEKDKESLATDLQIMKSECLRAKEIVRQLLEFAKKRSLQKQEFDIRKAINDVIELVKIQARGNKIEIRTEFSGDPLLAGDKNQLKQVFINIVNNAFHAMGDKGTLEITVTSDEEKVYISFKDTGPGIKEEVLKRVFEPFFSTKDERGTGIGLSVSYKIIQVHNGTIEVESAPGKGAAFTITLPRR